MAASLLTGAVISTLFAVQANENARQAHLEKDRANAKEREANANLYVAHMNLAQTYWEENNIARVRSLVDQYRQPQPGQPDWRG